MKIRPFRRSPPSIALLVIQLALVGSIAAKYLYQRWTCPRVWTRTSSVDPELLMRGRYLSLQLTVDGCRSTLPSGKQAEFPRDVNGAAVSGKYALRSVSDIEFPAELKVVGDKLTAIHIRDAGSRTVGQMVRAGHASQCDEMLLAEPVNFYIGEHAKSPVPSARGTELWIEVTVPPTGPPRPIQLALKQNGVWEPLAFE